MLVPQPFRPHKSVVEVEVQLDQVARLEALIEAVEK